MLKYVGEKIASSIGARKPEIKTRNYQKKTGRTLKDTDTELSE